jgi:ATP-dependent DNA helicase RecG
MALHSRDQLIHLVPQLAALPAETEWVEFKTDNDDPDMIGRTLAALANSARLQGHPYGHLVWGVQDGSHQIVGTKANPARKKVGNEDLLNWLTHSLSPEPFFEFEEFELGQKRVVVATIEAASFTPIQFKGVEYIRVGSHVKPLSKHADTARRLWKAFDRQPYEMGTAADQLNDDDVLGLLDYPSYFELLGLPLPSNRPLIFEALQNEGLIAKLSGTGWRVTNLGALLIAKSLDRFPSLQRRALRVIQYRGRNRVETVKEQVGKRGYASGFAGLIDYVNDALPTSEVIGQALRQSKPMYPELAVRELVANALIHQDFGVSGAGPMIEIFEDRIEISNPGLPIVDVAQLVNAARSRNELLAARMRRMGVCEERGSGWDKIAFQVELYQLPAPIVDIQSGAMRVTMLSPRPLREMSPENKARAVYLHACLRYVSQENTTNSSIRERFGISQQNKAMASRLLGDAVKKQLILPYDAEAPAKLMRYVPFWAGTEADAIGLVDAN